MKIGKQTFKIESMPYISYTSRPFLKFIKDIMLFFKIGVKKKAP